MAWALHLEGISGREAPIFKAHSSRASLAGQVLFVGYTSVCMSYIHTFYLDLQGALVDPSGKEDGIPSSASLLRGKTTQPPAV